MNQIYEYILNKNTKIKKYKEFPKSPIEQDIIDFLENNGFTIVENIKEEIGIDKNFEKSKGLSYAFIKLSKHFKNYNVILFYKGGKITKNNPCFRILVYKNEAENDISNGYISGEIYFDIKNIFAEKSRKRFDHCEYNKLVEEINEYFGWQS